jgi:recombination protein RecA
MTDTPAGAESRSEQYSKFIASQQKNDPGSIFKLNDDAVANVQVIPTGVIGLDIALGVGGLPRGRIVELFGPEMSGKTSLALAVAAEAQKMGGFVGVIDAEHAFSRDFAVKAFGIDETRLALAQPDDGIAGLQMVEKMCESKAFDVIIVDSVAALIPPAMAENAIGEANQLGQHAKMMSDGLRKLTPVVANSRAVVIMVNQIRMNPTAYGNPEVTTGGRALPFYASVRIEVRSPASKRLLDGKIPVGQTCSIKIKKNKVAPPHRETSYDLYYESGIAREASLIEAAEKMEVITRAGASYTEVATGERIAVGKEQVKEVLKTDDAMRVRLEKAVWEAAGLVPPTPPTPKESVVEAVSDVDLTEEV